MQACGRVWQVCRHAGVSRWWRAILMFVSCGMCNAVMLCPCNAMCSDITFFDVVVWRRGNSGVGGVLRPRNGVDNKPAEERWKNIKERKKREAKNSIKIERQKMRRRSRCCKWEKRRKYKRMRRTKLKKRRKEEA